MYFGRITAVWIKMPFINTSIQWSASAELAKTWCGFPSFLDETIKKLINGLKVLVIRKTDNHKSCLGNKSQQIKLLTQKFRTKKNPKPKVIAVSSLPLPLEGILASEFSHITLSINHFTLLTNMTAAAEKVANLLWLVKH